MADSVRRAEMAFKAALFFRWRIYPRRRAEAVSSESSRAAGVSDSLHRGRVPFLYCKYKLYFKAVYIDKIVNCALY